MKKTKDREKKNVVLNFYGCQVLNDASALDEDIELFAAAVEAAKDLPELAAARAHLARLRQRVRDEPYTIELHWVEKLKFSETVSPLFLSGTFTL